VENEIFKKFPRFRGQCKDDCVVDFLGIQYSEPYEKISTGLGDRFLETTYPEISEEYFEWVDILESALHSKNSYLMFEIGAGYGRWGLRAWKAAKTCGVKQPQIVCVEAEPDHARWIDLHFRKNQVPGENYKIIEAAVSDEDGQADFFVQWHGRSRERSSKEWYGQALAKAPWDGSATIPVKKMSINKLLEPYKNQIIDLIDMDIQGEEAKVINQLLIHLKSIKTIHIGTHSKEIEAEIKKHLREARWILKREYSIGETYEIGGTLVKFGDGVQAWKNPLFSK